MIKKVMEYAAIGKCAEMVGGARAVLQATVDYANIREQYGQPIGSFQVFEGKFSVNVPVIALSPL